MMVDSSLLVQKPPAPHTPCQYIVFVGTLTSVTSLLMLATPRWILNTRRCVGLHCLSLERDLLKSIASNKNPCNNFYEYVCSRWPDRAGTRYITPTDKYSTHIEKFLLRNILLRSLTERSSSQSVPQKVTILIVKCVQRLKLEDQLVSSLRELKLLWPLMSQATKLDILDILAGASLDHGTPALWSFLVGRHPKKPRQNIIYLTLDSEISLWFGHVRKLKALGSFNRYLRACAETVGGKGQSYDRMIKNVLAVHDIVEKNMSSQLRVYEPRYMSYDDIELRLAVNRHLPDNSQQWPSDSILCLQQAAFLWFADTLLGNSARRMQLKLYIGAYLVWYLSPLTSSYLTELLMKEIQSKRTDVYVRKRCFDAITRVMPLVVWKTNMDALTDAAKAVVFETYGHLWTSIVQQARAYDSAAAQTMETLMVSLSVNAYNMSITWEITERAYSHIPRLHGNFFEMYSEVARATARFSKEAIRSPSHDVLHLPGIVQYRLYRLLVCREIATPLTLIFRPVLDVFTPTVVKMATLGAHFATIISHLFYFVYFEDDDFMLYSKEDLEKIQFPAEMRIRFLALHNDIQERFGASADDRGRLFFLLVNSIGLNFSYAALKKIKGDANRAYENFVPDKLFFEVACFLHCQSSNVSSNGEDICNWVAPQTSGFHDAFNCKPGQPMYISSKFD